MYTLIYSSEVVKYMGDIDISSMLYAAREDNAEHKITGLLIYSNEHFLHVIEGEKDAVKQCYEVVERDRRHQNLNILMEKEINERQFTGWNLGFKHIPDEELDNHPLLASFLKGESGAPFTEACYDYLVSFRLEEECEEAFY